MENQTRKCVICGTDISNETITIEETDQPICAKNEDCTNSLFLLAIHSWLDININEYKNKESTDVFKDKLSQKFNEILDEEYWRVLSYALADKLNEQKELISSKQEVSVSSEGSSKE